MPSYCVHHVSEHLFMMSPVHTPSRGECFLERVAPNGTLAERKAAHLSLLGCDREAV